MVNKLNEYIMKLYDRIIRYIFDDEQSFQDITLEDRINSSTYIDKRSDNYGSITDIEVWYGDGDCNPLGPIEAILVEPIAHNKVKFRIIDKAWLDHTGIETDWEFEYSELPPSNFISYDAYAFTTKGAGPEPNRWWAELINEDTN